MVARFYPEEAEQQTPEKLLHELLVHKVELELQIEELRLAYVSMEEMRDRYFDLYEFAPTGYMTINREGTISEINLAGSAMLGVERCFLIGMRFSKLIAADDQDRWHLLFMKMLGAAKGERQEIDLALTHADKSVFHARLECLRWEVLEAQTVLRLAFILGAETQGIVKH